MLYLNVLLVEKRHWPREAEGRPMWAHHAVRAVGIILAVIGLNAILGRAGLRMDATAEGLHSLSGETKRLIAELSEERPVFIQAYVSPEVSEQLVQTRANLLGVLNEIKAVGGARIQVMMEDVDPFTPQARDAREKFGITPRQIPHLGSARAGFSDVFLGIAFTCGAEEQVIPFLERGLPIEYEIVRSIRVVARTERRRIGMVGTEAKLFGGFDFQTMRSDRAWSVVSELEKQYEVIQVSASSPIRQELDGLLSLCPPPCLSKKWTICGPTWKRGTPPFCWWTHCRPSTSAWPLRSEREPTSAPSCVTREHSLQSRKVTSRPSSPISEFGGIKPVLSGTPTIPTRI